MPAPDEQPLAHAPTGPVEWFDACPEAIVAFDARGVVTGANVAAGRLFDRGPSDLVGVAIRDLLPSLFADGSSLRNLVGGWRNAAVALPGRPTVPVRVRVGEARDPAGARYVAAVDDCTERDRHEARLRELLKIDALGRFSGIAAHQFNNLLTVVSGYAEMLAADLPIDDPRRAFALEIERTVQRGVVLTQQLLTFGGQRMSEPVSLDLNAVIHGLERMVRRLLSDRTELKLELNPSLGRVVSDATQIEQVVVNLCANAHEAMPNGGKLTLKTANVDWDAKLAHAFPHLKPGPYVELTATDTGPGVDEASRERLFEPFFSTRENGSGRGMGLATAFSIARHWGGHLAVGSGASGGAAFRMLLPRERRTGAEEVKTPVGIELPGGAETILVVEDEPDVRNMMQTALSRLGYRTLVASSALEARALIGKDPGPIDVLVADVMMPPGESGVDLATDLLRTHPNLRVLLVSGYTGETVLRESMVEQGLAFLPKPFAAAPLAAKIRTLLDAGPRA